MTSTSFLAVESISLLDVTSSNDPKGTAPERANSFPGNRETHFCLSVNCLVAAALRHVPPCSSQLAALHFAVLRGEGQRLRRFYLKAHFDLASFPDSSFLFGHVEKG
jgi:hypothetical protein